MNKQAVIPLTEITHRNIGNFQNQILAASKLNPEILVLDMQTISIIDSFGLRTILNTLRKIRETGGELVLWHVQPAVLTILEITEMDKVFTISYAA